MTIATVAASEEQLRFKHFHPASFLIAEAPKSLRIEPAFQRIGEACLHSYLWTDSGSVLP
jgi:hypothetical protein